MISQNSLKNLAQKIASYHKPVKTDYYSRFSISEVKQTEPAKPQMVLPQITLQENPSKYYCYSCKKPISKKVAAFCFSDKARFQRKAYCYGCQRTVDSRNLP